MAGRLTKTAVEGLKPPTGKGGQSFLWDGELKGFGVRVIHSGLKTFVLQYRDADDRTRRIKLGRFGAITVENARDLAKVKFGELAKGNDPAKRPDTRRKTTVAALCDWYLGEAKAGRILGRRNRPIKASTLAMDKSRIETHIKPLLGKTLVHTLKVADIERMQSDIVAGKTAKPRGGGRGGVTTGGPGVAARTVSTLQSILGHATRLDRIEAHPSKGARKLAGKKKNRRLSVPEITKLGQAIRYATLKETESPIALAILRLLLLSGFRISEAQGLEREWVSGAAGYVGFPDTKGDAQIRAIGPAAAKLIAEQPARANSPYVFPSEVSEGHYTAAKACLERLCVSVGLEGVTPHTLRHTFASVSGDLGFSELTIRALLGHGSQSVTQDYIHIDEALKLAATRTSDEIASLLDGAKRGKDPGPSQQAA
ncbi:MAG: tyrosine-type recombinase/integrase [Rhodospirillales bacterium]|nr:tyrosine-type recombinase/integrase [Rhodospirillales bacterium]